MLRLKFRVWMLVSAVVLILASTQLPLAAQEQPVPSDVCEDTRYLMARDATPYDFIGEGGVLPANIAVEAPFSRDIYAQFYALRIQRELNAFNNLINADLALNFDNVPRNFPLEFGLFRGMEQIGAYQPVIDETVNLTLTRDGVYTLVVRRVHVHDLEIEGAVTLTASYPGDTTFNIANLPDASTRLLLNEAPFFEAGLTVIPLTTADVRLHTQSAIGTGTLEGRGAQVRFDPGAVTVGTWAEQVALLGGDLAASGSVEQPRIFFLEDFGYQRELVDEDLNIEDANGTIIVNDWQDLKGLWLFNDCIGVELLDGRTFIAPTQPEARQVSFTGGIDAFAARFNSLDAAGALTPYSLTWEWNGVAEGGEVRLANGILTMPLLEGRTLVLQTTNATIDRRDDEPITATTLLDVTLIDRNISLTLDWVNFNRAALLDETVSLQFTDARQSLEPTLTRTAASLLRVDAERNVIQLVYQDRQEQGVVIPGEQRLLLSAEEGFIEIVTPEGFPTFDSTALPDEPGYAPRGLNNLGGECYPVNTTLEEANCPPNGEPNPANGNLWYGVTDLRAFGGYGLDLTLTRSYNSRASHIDSPFGFGWSTEYLLDYNVRFDQVQGSRPVSPETVAAYRVGLDVTYAPRGIVTFTTPSGSRHVFASQSPSYTSGSLNALTMPGWTLQRDDLRANWVLTQTDGFEYQFDRAGRMVSYGYPQVSRVVTIEYPRSSINGVVGLEPAAIAISDDFSQRQIELYYDNFYRIEKSILRDMTRSQPFGACELSDHCYATTYRYNADGMLVAVNYAGGLEATYEYDEQRNLIAHNDPRAPIAPEMRYSYNAENLTRVEVVIEGEPRLWREISPPRIFDDTRIVTLTDDLNRRRTYIYAQTPAVLLREVGSGYTLLSVSSPFSDFQEAGSDALTQSYTWANGLLTQINARILQDRVGRNSTSFRYDSDATLQTITGGFLDFDSTLDPTASEIGLIRFADDTTLTYTYDAAGRPASVTDRLGETHQFTWNANGRLASRTRASDGQSWTYRHNPLGLITMIATGNHTVGYEWDAIGRLVQVEDALLGVYTIEYRACDGEACPAGFTDMTVIDPLGVQTLSRFDVQGRLMETQQRTRDNPSLRHMTYEYDVFDRLTAETVYALEAQYTENPDDTDQLLRTRYSYAPVERLQEADGSSTLIYGYSITRQDAYGRREVYTYDAFDRIRQVEDTLRQVTRYDYTNTTVVYNNGFQVEGRELRGAQVVATTTYLFDLAGQLREITRVTGPNSTSPNSITWRLITEGDPVKPRFLEAVGADIVALTWGEYAGMFPNTIQLRPVSLPLVSNTQQPTLTYTTTYDTLGRIIQTTDGDGIPTQRAYCPLPDGGYEERVSSAGRIEALTCDVDDVAAQTVYDIHGRVLSGTDAFGTQTTTYSRDDAAQEWGTAVTFNGENGAVWEQRYNAAGDLTYWLGESGIVRRYRHDGAGRLIRVETEGAPEASFTFEYNAADLVTRQVDDLGRGFVYQYDERGLLLVRQDALTADATTFGYGPFGEITSAISPLGNTTAFRYDDLNDPTRLTGIIDPTGVLETFEWDDNANTLTFADVRGGQTRYFFDSLGALWQIQDAAGQFHELHYDESGYLTEVLTAQPAGGESGPVRTLQISPPVNGLRTVSEVNQPDWSWTFVFNSLGVLNGLTDPTGNLMFFGYDTLGQIRNGAVTSSSEVEEDGTLMWQIERQPGSGQEGGGQADSRQQSSLELRLNGGAPDEITERYSFDSLYRLTSVTDPDGIGTFYEYDTDESGSTTFTTRQNGSGGRVYTFAPGNDSAESRTVTVDAPGQRQTYFYNAEGLIEEFRREVCIANRVDSCEPGEGTIWTTSVRFRYDAQGRPVVIVDEEQNVETFAYDDLGNLTSYQTPNGKTFSYTYDRLNRLLTVTSPTGIKVLLRYDALDHVTGVCRTRAEAPNDFTVCEQNDQVLETYTYDSLGRLTGQTFPNETPNGSTTISQSYTQGRLTEWGIPGFSVQRVYEQNALALLDQLVLSGRRFDFAYDAKLRLTQGGENLYAYDAYGRLARFTENERIFEVDYADEDRGYRLTNTQTGEAVRYGLDARGFLSALDYGLAEAPDTIPLLNIQYRLTLRQPTTLSVVMNSEDNSRTLDLQLNRQRETRNLVMSYDDRRLLVDYITDPVGLVTRQRIDGSPTELFAGGAGGYIIVTGYDDDNRPTTVRITDKSGGRLLYVLNFTYSSGQRVSEARSYSDNTQMLIGYEYATPNQLTRRTVEIIPPTTAHTLPMLTAMVTLPLLLWWRRHRWLGALARRRYRELLRIWLRVALSPLSMFVLCSVGALFIYSHADAQQQSQARTQRFVFEYRYDDAGNIEQIIDADRNVVCRTYRYDGANHLTEIVSGENTRTYAVNLYNQITAVGDTELMYAGAAQPFAADQAEQTLYYGREKVRPPFWIASSGAISSSDGSESDDQIIWQMPNGRDRVLSVVNGDDDSPIQPVRILDPLGRNVALSLPFDLASPDFDSCLLNDDLGGTQPLLPQQEFSQMVYADGLYFSADGRTYDPVIGRFLQRDPYGPDVLGILYDLGQPQPVPAQRRSVSTIAGGLATYRDALALSRARHALTADSIARTYTPALQRSANWTEALAVPDPSVAQLVDLLALPTRLQNAYNLPGAQIDPVRGAILLQTNSTPGQGGLLMPAASPTAFTASNTLQRLVGNLDIPYSSPPTSYQSRLWLPDGYAELSDLWQDRAPRVGLAYTPNAVLQWLPRPLSAPENAFETLALAETLTTLPEMTGRDWLQSIVYDALPQLPELPPQGTGEWRDRWFTADTLGLQRVLAERIEVPPLPALPVYELAFNKEWVFNR